MNRDNLKMLEQAIEYLRDLLTEVVFVGGATVELWITDAAAPEFRPTTDVDVIVEVTTRAEYYRFEERIRSVGFENDAASRVICRFRHHESGLVLDVMPTEASILGFENRWQKEAFAHAVETSLPTGAPQELQEYISEQLLTLAMHRDFDRGLEGALPSSPESRGRVDRVIWPRVRRLMVPAALVR